MHLEWRGIWLRSGGLLLATIGRWGQRGRSSKETMALIFFVNLFIKSCERATHDVGIAIFVGLDDALVSTLGIHSPDYHHGEKLLRVKVTDGIS
jgi:hypothetical protein